MNIHMHWRIIFALAIGGLLILVAIGSTSQAAPTAGPWYVAPGGDDGDTCTTAISPCATINGAISKAVYGDTIYVAIGTYTGTGSPVVSLSKSVTLSGGWDSGFITQSSTSIIDGENTHRGIFVSNGRVVTVERFVIQNGFDSSGRGGGIHNYQGTLTLNNSVVSSGTGKGIFNEGGTVTLNDSTVSGHTYGISNGGTMTLNNSTVNNNKGSGIYNGDTLFLNNTTVSNNVREPDFEEPGNGIYNRWNGITTVNNCTITGNAGTGIYNESSIGGVSLQNSIVAGNTADCEGALGSSGYNLIGETSGCSFTPGTGDLTNVSANLGQLVGPTGAPGYHPLLSGSPAIDAGNPGGCIGSAGPLTTDQRGAARVGRCDIGSYEYTTPGPAASIYAYGGTPQRTPPFGAFEVPIQAVALDGIGSPVHTATVTFSAPVGGASGMFMDTGSFTTTATTSESGVATAATFIANGLLGGYTVTATVGSVVTPANFLLTNAAWYVTPDGDDANDCQTSTTPCATINGALAKVGFTAGDTVLASTGTYTGTGSEVVLLDKDADLSGGWDSSFVTQTGMSTIDGENAHRGITVNNGVTSIVERFTIQNGYSDQGGGIYNLVGFLTLISCAVEGNSATFGGGIQSIGGTLTVDSSILSGNTATEYSSGSGIRASGTVILNRTTVSGNIGGGGIANSNAMTLTHSIVSGNIGRGIDNGGTLILNSSTVNGNIAPDGDGAGISNGGTLILNNTTVSGNVAANGSGGGISNDDGNVIINSSTISGNTASGIGGGFDNEPSFYNAVTLQNTILAGNTAWSSPDCRSLYAGTFSSAGYNLVGNTYGCNFTPGPGDLLNVEARLSPLEGSPGYHPLLPESPAINAGNPGGCTDHLDNPLHTDQRGFPRFGRCDIGAYELQPIGFSTKVVNRSTALAGDSLTYTIVLTNGGLSDIPSAFLTDTLPISVTYSGLLTATSGTCGYASDVITWTGDINAGQFVAVTFQVTVTQTVDIFDRIANSAVINGGGEVITRTAVVEIGSFIYLPAVLNGWESGVVGSNPTDLKQASHPATRDTNDTTHASNGESIIVVGFAMVSPAICTADMPMLATYIIHPDLTDDAAFR